MFGAALALALMPTLGWHWYLGLAATPLALVLVFFPVRSFNLRIGVPMSIEVDVHDWEPAHM